MQQRPLFTNGPLVSALGLGTWPLGGGMGALDKQSAIDTVRAAIDQGITLIDTAQMYRSSESILGEALRDGYRERCFLATKVSGDFTAQNIRSAMENSLRQLRVDAVDLYQIHFWDDRYPVDEAMGTMARLQQEGKTRYIGVSNYTHEQMQTALNTAPFQTNQLEYHMFARDIEQAEIPFCESHGIGILAHSVLAKGLLTGKYSPNHRFPEDDERSQIAQFREPSLSRYLSTAEKLKTIAGDYQLTLVQLSIAWVLHQPSVCSALVGAKSPQQVQDFLGAGDVSLTADTLREIDTILDDLTGVARFEPY
jgi:aryl-alcohol dehydrogenase-like predicted oxidoreductase